MVDILGHFNQYVPTTMDQKGIAEQVLFGGDQLTAERTRSAKALQLNARTEHGQLHGLVPFIEDWHALQCMLQVIIYFHFACCQTIKTINNVCTGSLDEILSIRFRV